MAAMATYRKQNNIIVHYCVLRKEQRKRRRTRIPYKRIVALSGIQREIRPYREVCQVVLSACFIEIFIQSLDMDEAV